MKILMILTSHGEFGDSGNPTGFWLEEFAAPYYRFIDSGATVTLASPEGGQPPVDPGSRQPQFLTGDTARFDSDEEARAAMANTARLSGIDPSGFDALFFPGGHGPLWDLHRDDHSLALVSDFHAAGKPVGAVCHGTAALLNATDDAGRPLVEGHEITGFTDSEENEICLSDQVPVSVEREANRIGAKFRKGGNWEDFAIRDGLFMTGQNPQSSTSVADLVVKALNGE